MKINTRRFGEIEIDADKILFMPEGLPGFPGFERFVLFEDPQSAPFCWFQSMEEPNLALVMLSPFVFKPDYEIDLKEFIVSRGWKDIQVDDLLVYVVINIFKGERGKRITANLMGPIIINSINNQAIQVVISDSTYSHQHNVIESS
ncbi:flagellar assembly protein FliW [Desulfobacula toluolica]|uniref:Flagellar assembly factor FliW n=1 Tax=Desulfobacula toluolica (strain DSM 7467 / Tol2) TaxID=651182 RepID=K0NJM5_DESTT|nr:flagellar assembly protein FliW [Desulfobacula toluolica]CCK81706.1 FliW: flagellar assembly factor [Desulfobacula toluolica Tol2]